MLKNAGQVGNAKSSPNVSMPRTVTNMPIGLPIAKKALGLKANCGYFMKGCPVPAAPIT